MSKFTNVRKRLNAAYLPNPYDYYSARLEGLKGRSDGKQCKALCPFHAENTGSFVFQNETGKFKCFGCGVSGSLIDFEMLQASISFIDACKALGAWV